MVIYDEKAPVGAKSIAVDPRGEYMAVTDLNGCLKMLKVPAASLADGEGGLPDTLDIEEMWSDQIVPRDDGSDETKHQIARTVRRGLC